MPGRMPAASEITGLVLAGGRGSRMDGLDKGLQPFRGRPLAARAIARLAPQVGALQLSANRHFERYAAFGVPVCPDGVPGFVGPLAGFLAGLEACDTPYLLTVPCDVPRFPPDLAVRLAAALAQADAELAMACARGADGQLQPQPVFCLLRRSLAPGLRRFLEDGGRQVGAWAAQQHAVPTAFDLPGDDAQAFANANTLAELQALEQLPP